MANKIYIEGQGVVNMDADESAALDARRASDAAWRTEALRTERNKKLAETDWTQNRDVTLSNDADWKTYRQALRDITKEYKSLEDVKWPEKPE